MLQQRVAGRANRVQGRASQQSSAMIGRGLTRLARPAQGFAASGLRPSGAGGFVAGKAMQQRPSSWWRTMAVDTRLEAAAPAAAADEAVEGKSSAYPFAAIEAKWQEYWEQNQTFRTPDEIDTSKPKYYVLDMFPYPR